MNLTPEQIAIIQSTGNIKINAIAGSGKTTTIIEYARTRPENSRILYLAFNKSVRLDASARFLKKNLNNVRVETAHSLAFKNIVFKHGYKVHPTGYKSHELVDLLGLGGYQGKLTEYILANHISKFLSYFCNSDKTQLSELNYPDILTDRKAQTFVSNYHDEIEKHTTILLRKMDKGQIDISHDFYLKKYQLSNPKLNYDYILFDEGQDASAAMLDVFLKQSATKVIVGDTHQQIYGWRFAVNSLEKTSFSNYNLSTSFRFGQDIANLAMEALELKSLLDQPSALKITGSGSSLEAKTTATIARTNLGLLKNAIEYAESKEAGTVYFEGNIHSYTYADEGASLFDVLNLQKNRKRMIRDKMISRMKNVEELEEYIDKTNDVQLGMMVDIVETYGDNIPAILNDLIARHVGDADKENADRIFSTVHRCKGMEYDVIHLADDFMTKENLVKSLDPRKDQQPDIVRLKEEINLLYVAITRTKNKLHIPESLVPENFPASPCILIEKKVPVPDITAETTPSDDRGKTYSVEEVRARHKDAYRP